MVEEASKVRETTLSLSCIHKLTDSVLCDQCVDQARSTSVGFRIWIVVPARLTSKWLAEILGDPDRSCRHALRALADRGVVEADQIHRWVPTTWDRVASSAVLADSRESRPVRSAEDRPMRFGNHVPELAAKSPPSSWRRVPRACGSLSPGSASPAATSPPSIASVRTLSTRARALPPKDLPPSFHPEAGREGQEQSAQSADDQAGLVPLARTVAKSFAARNVVVDLGHAVSRLAAAKERYGMSDEELERYLRTAPDQPGLSRAGFPFGAALSPGRVEPWLAKHRRRRDDVPGRSQLSEVCPLPVSELGTRSAAFLSSLVGRRGEM